MNEEQRKAMYQERTDNYINDMPSCNYMEVFESTQATACMMKHLSSSDEHLKDNIVIIFGCLSDLVKKVEESFDGNKKVEEEGFRPTHLTRNCIPSYFERACYVFFPNTSTTWENGLQICQQPTILQSEFKDIRKLDKVL
jgi:hypothetical protein